MFVNFKMRFYNKDFKGVKRNIFVAQKGSYAEDRKNKNKKKEEEEEKQLTYYCTSIFVTDM